MLTRSEIENFCMDLERDGVSQAHVILRKFYAVLQDRDEQSAIIGRLRDALQYARATLADHHDIEDGGDGDEVHQRPNWAMRATNAIDEVLSETRFAKANANE